VAAVDVHWAAVAEHAWMHCPRFGSLMKCRALHSREHI
jgi:hypothetical protein